MRLSPAPTPAVDKGLILSLQELPTQTAGVAAAGERAPMSVAAIGPRLRVKIAAAIVDSHERVLGKAQPRRFLLACCELMACCGAEFEAPPPKLRGKNKRRN